METFLMLGGIIGASMLLAGLLGKLLVPIVGKLCRRELARTEEGRQTLAIIDAALGRDQP